MMINPFLLGEKKKRQNFENMVLPQLPPPPTLPRQKGPSMVQLVRGSLIESLDRGSNPLVGAPHV
jgi:hypothetical protein